MGPKRRAAPKAKVAVDPETTETLPDLSTITIRRKVPNEVIKENHEDEILSENLETPVVLIEEMTDVSKSIENTESEKSDTKVFVKKTKGKSKLPKNELEDKKILRGRTRSSSVDRKPIFKTLEKKETVGKSSRKRCVDKDVSPDISSKTKNITSKRNRRACSVDILSTNISKTLVEGNIIVNEGTQQINKKKIVKEIESTLSEALPKKVLITKPKKKMKKNVKEPLLITQEISTDSPDMYPEETEQIDKPELEPSTKKTGKKMKIKQNDEMNKESILKNQNSPSEESSANNNSDDGDMVHDNIPEPITKKTGKTRRVPKVKQNSPLKDCDELHDLGDCDLQLDTPEIKPKRGVKKGKGNEQKDAEDKTKISKRGRKIKVDNLEEPQNSSPVNDVEEINEKTDIPLDIPESEKTYIKPMVKRKTKAKK